MRLKKLVICGFKSFADRTVLEFDSGVTGVVGPNGCGKSNISDAFRWVFGEQSARSMRGDKMQDVIFAGTTQRKPLNFAEVTITLTEINGALPVDFEEIEVTRRLFRDGESEYRLNGNVVRLKDIQSLFWDSGLGKDAFAIFEQGKIDQVINLGPNERRYIFEEAAGILRFKQRRKEALRKLEQTEINLSRVSDIHKELEKQVRVLDKQMVEARAYKENKVKLEVLEKAVLVAKWEALQNQQGGVSGKSGSAKEALEQAQEAVRVLDQESTKIKAKLSESEKAFRVQNELFFKTRGAKELKAQELKAVQERLREAKEKEIKLKKEAEDLQQGRASSSKEVEETQKRYDQVKQDLAEREKEREAKRQEMRAVQNEINRLRDQQKLLQQERLEVVQKEHRITGQLQENKIRLETGRERIKHLQVERDRFQGSIEQLTASVVQKREQLEQISLAVDEQKKASVIIETQFVAKNQAILVCQKELEGIQWDATELKARQKVLIQLKEQMEGFTPATKRLLLEAADPNSSLFDKLQGLCEFIVPERGHEPALAAVLRSYAQTLVVRTKEDAQLVSNFAQSHELNDFSLICLEALSETSKVHKKGDTLLSYVLENDLSRHFLQNVYLRSEQEEIIESPKDKVCEWVTSNGVFVDSRKVIFYPLKGETNIYLRDAELGTIELQLKKLELRKQEIEAESARMNQDRVQLQSQRGELDRTLRREEMKLVEVNFGLQQALADVEKGKLSLQQTDKELDSLEQKLQQFTVTIAELNEMKATAQAAVGKQQEELAEVETGLEKHLTEVKSRSREQQEKENAVKKVSDECQALLRNLKVFEAKGQEGERLQKKLQDDLVANNQAKEKFTVQITELDQALQQTEEGLTQSTSSYTVTETEVVQWKGKFEEVEKKKNALQEQMQPLQEERRRLDVLSAQQASVRGSIETELKERYQLTIEEAKALELQLEGELENSEKIVRQLRREVEKVGSINLAAVDEFDQSKARYEFLDRELKDLQLSRKELMQIISKLDRSSRKIFKETFEAIQANFKRQFQILFNGGEADLTFTDSQDILEAGIEIIAKPPGKQMRSINLLSGGEKCLTAVALLFSIFEVKPAPFCILDEIDAPLDESNIERFTRVVQQFLDRTQFILITHNKRTMSMANVLFGISMEEKGVSKIISIAFDKQSNRNPEPVLAQG